MYAVSLHLTAIFISKSGGIYARSIIDDAVFSPERIIYTARPILSEGLVQDDPEIKFYPGNFDYALPQPLASTDSPEGVSGH